MVGYPISTRLALRKQCLRIKIIPWLLALIVTAFSLGAMNLRNAWAGPPFVTDDPEPVEYRHWEVYVASEYANHKDGFSGTAPHFEVNYGVWPNVQLHLIAPFAYNKPQDGAMQYGIGDMELGVKYRFIQETDSFPMVGTFPLIEVPTGDSSRALGNGSLQLFLPLWLQKSWGPWTTYGGGGYWRNPGSGNKDYLTTVRTSFTKITVTTSFNRNHGRKLFCDDVLTILNYRNRYSYSSTWILSRKSFSLCSLTSIIATTYSY